MTPASEFSLSCPVGMPDSARILLAHGGGGRLSHELIEKVFLPAFGNEALNARHDSAVLAPQSGSLAFTTDAYVVKPLFFPGGDIGTLAVNGTVNDLSMAGARPLWLSAAFIIEEGLPLEILRRIVMSMQKAAQEAGVQIVTGDTKVVDRGKADGLFITTSGVGVVEHDLPIAPASVRADDAILLSGDLGRHGIAVMSAREGIAFETSVESDCAPLSAMIQDLIAHKIEIHCMRDLTRGGLASALNEIALAARVKMEIEEDAIRSCEGVQSACEILGLDPLYVANEGRCVVFVPASDFERALNLLRSHPVGKDAGQIGRVVAAENAIVVLKTRFGSARIVDMLSGEQLPRIC